MPLFLCVGLALPVASDAQPAPPTPTSPPLPRPTSTSTPHEHHHHPPQPDAGGGPVPSGRGAPVVHAHSHDVGPAGATYDLRFLDAMVQHHTGALRMSEFVFDIGQPGIGALAKQIWRDQAQEIKAMGQWRKAWYPGAPVYPVALRPGGDPDSLDGLTRMSAEQIAAMRMVEATPTPDERVVWFLEGMLHHHGGALLMAHDALAKSTRPTLRRLARQIIQAQRGEILQLRRMLRHEGLDKPEYRQYDRLFQPA